jgi:hypothetical protein
MKGLRRGKYGVDDRHQREVVIYTFHDDQAVELLTLEYTAT